MTISEESTTPTNNINTLRDNSYKRAPLPTPNQSEAEIVEKSATNNIEGNGPLGNREIKGKRTEELSFRLPAGNLADKEEERRFSISSFTSQSSSLFEERAPDPPLADGKTTSSTKANKRLRIFQEIVETERRYCQDLEFIKNYRDPLLATAGTPDEVISKSLITHIFAHQESILAVSLELKAQLEDRLSQWSGQGDSSRGKEISCGKECVGDIFLSLSPFLRVYSLFLSNFNASSALVSSLLKNNPLFAAVIKRVDSMPTARSLSLTAFLMTPVQRIPRYKMLLEDLFKNTPPTHPDFEDLEKAIVLVQEIASSVNEHIRDHEMMLKMLDLQRSIQGLKENLVSPGRRFLKRGPVLKISRRSHQPRELLLFTDMLIYASHSRLEEGTLLCHRSIPLSGLSVNDIPDSQDFINIFQLFNREKSFAVYTETKQEKKEWIDAISTAIQNTMDIRTIKKEINPAAPPLPAYTAPIWVPDNQAKNCLVCKHEFSFVLRRHHCRYCGGVTCHPCSRNSFFAPSEGGERQCRVCDTCFPVIVEKKEFRIHVAPIPEYFDDRSSMESNRLSLDLSPRLSQDTITRDSFSSRTSLDFSSSRHSFDVSRVFNRRVVAPVHPPLSSSMARFDVASIYNRITGRPRASRYGTLTTSACTLCLSPFSIYSWKYHCLQCERSVCSSCCSRSSKSETICDPCAHQIDPMDVIINPEGSGWGARFSLDV